MFDIKMILQDKETTRDRLRLKNVEADLDTIAVLEGRRKEIIAESQQLKEERNRASEEINQAKKEGRDARTAIEAVRQVSDRIKKLDIEQGDTEKNLRERMLEIPNLPHESVPKGKHAGENVVIKEWGESSPKPFKLKNHIELSETLDILDFKRGAKLAGSGFVLYKGAGARLERALINYFLDHNTRKGFTEMFPPFLVNPACAEGTGQLPKSRDQMYYINEDNLFLIPTAEVPVTNIHRDEVLSAKELPLCYTAYSACFRREAGSWGKDTRGFLRVHEFNKVELVKFTTPETSYDELETLRATAESLLQGLGLRYRVLALCTGDLSFAAAKCYDLEVYAEGEGRWLEVSSCSNFEDFQARRANIRYKTNEGKTQFVHTLNGSGLATARILVALLENNQQADGSVLLPEVLSPYLGGEREIRKK
ncbi:MAG: serine--tRNA ligase [Elusimicrobia bacterium RIFOXYB2_FULL_49_7]|nr:MAG: serine--tRNA ligase [Elusimicrobia bacterium RIFOXYB2_FULL_49_7]